MRRDLNLKRPIEITVFFLVLLLATSLLPAHLSWVEAGDWRLFFRPAGQNLLSPYSNGGIYNPPWLIAMIAPLAWLPTRVGAALLGALTLTVLVGYVKTWPKILALLLSAPVLATICNGQVDIIPLLGLIGPMWCSLPLLAVKPQGVFLAALRRLTPTSIAFLLTVLAASFLVWGFWPLQIAGMPQTSHNQSLFPWSLIVTAGILIWLRAHRDSRYADALLCLASLAAFPYFGLHSLLPAVALFIRNTESRAGCAAICACTWLYVFLK
jgi:hypothetical protein